jgi:hypothetical protein
MLVILYFRILLHCIVQWVLQVMLLSACSFIVLVFTVFHYMFRPTWPSSCVGYIYFHMPEGFCFAAFFFCLLFHVVTLCTCPSMVWVKYEVLLFMLFLVLLYMCFFTCVFPVLFSFVNFVVSCVCVCLLAFSLLFVCSVLLSVVYFV